MLINILLTLLVVLGVVAFIILYAMFPWFVVSTVCMGLVVFIYTVVRNIRGG